MSTPRQERRRSDASANVARIVAAAREVFARDGDAATLSQVAITNDITPAVLALGGDAPREAFIDAVARLEDAMFVQRPLPASMDDLA
jgi:hypothetical protein